MVLISLENLLLIATDNSKSSNRDDIISI